MTTWTICFKIAKAPNENLKKDFIYFIIIIFIYIIFIYIFIYVIFIYLLNLFAREKVNERLHEHELGVGAEGEAVSLPKRQGSIPGP